MNKIVTIFSFRRSVGKSSLTANLATLLALQGLRVGLVDTDFQGSSAHLFFRLSDEDIKHTFNEYLWNKCDVLDAVHDVTSRLGDQVAGKLFLVPASTQITDIMQMLRTNLNVELLTTGLGKLEKKLKLDILLMDTPAGLNENNLMSIAVTNVLIVVLRPNPQDFQGTAVSVDVARRLNVPTIHLVLNDASETLNIEEASLQLEQTYQCGRGIVLTHAEELLALGSSQPFVLSYPEHPLTARIKELAERL